MCVPLCTRQHRTVLIIFPLIHRDNHHSSDDAYWRGAGQQLLLVPQCTVQFCWVPRTATLYSTLIAYNWSAPAVCNASTLEWLPHMIMTLRLRPRHTDTDTHSRLFTYVGNLIQRRITAKTEVCPGNVVTYRSWNNDHWYAELRVPWTSLGQLQQTVICLQHNMQQTTSPPCNSGYVWLIDWLS